MRRALLLLLLLAALARWPPAAAARTTTARPAPTTTSRRDGGRGPAPRTSSSSTTAGKLTIGTDNPAFPPWFDGGTPQGLEVGDQRPGARARASRARSPTRSPSELGLRARTRSSGSSSRSTSRSGPGRRTSTSTSTRSRSGPSAPRTSTSASRTTTSTRRSSRCKGTPIAKAKTARRPEGRQARRADRHDEPRLHQRRDPAERGAVGLQHQQRRDLGAEGEADRRDRRRPADRVLRHRRAGRRTATSSASSRTPASRSSSGSCSRRTARSTVCVNEAVKALREDGTLDADPAGVARRQGERAGARSRRSRKPQLQDPRLGGEGGRSVAVAVASTVVFFGARSCCSSSTRRAGPRSSAPSSTARSSTRRSRPSPRRSLLNVRIFLIAEVVILVAALGIAVLRSLPGPVFFPLRALAVVYTDLFRGIPTILVVYILGFGAPALRDRGRAARPAVLGDRRRSCSSTRRTSPRSTARGSTPCTRARRRPPARSG